ncbi:ABC transporter permease [Phenylobacterium montanum]|uniref:ATP-binding cassette domain-containing protein n=1 Tax=Phenylobacterium montanum TaxID=2823693 RepID=A0A975FYL7_9CAUL|nr:ABC transporter permease [Caulobacter sp. S6]QUD87853.1 ATP-binding cassette domain-containing protein [Caulobacter sp. S6]
MTAPVIALAGLNRTFKLGETEVRALQDVNLSIEAGEFVAIMGSSGSGKSTLMNIIGCLDQPSEGHYLFEGRDVAGLPEPDLAWIRSQRIGFVFQNFNLLPRTSALENVTLPLLYGEAAALSARERAARGRASLAALGLADRERSTPSQLSGGQQQRVALARALINQPAVLLADEPTGNLDTRTSHEIMDVICRLNREQGVTVILVTHEADIGAYADRLIVMRDGRVVSDQRQNGTKAGEPKAAPPPPSRAGDGSQSGLRTAFLSMVFAAALQALSRNKMRSALTMLGVFIGVAALIAMVAVGDGASAAVKKQLESLGTNMVVVLPGAALGGGVRGGAGSASTLTVADAEALPHEDPAVQRISYMVRRGTQVVYGDQNWSTAVQGVTPTYLDIVSWRIATGEAMTEQQNDSADTVCLIGRTVSLNLFGQGVDPIGATILVKGVPMRVIGLLASKGQTGFGQDQDDVVLIPFNTAERRVLGVAAPQAASDTVSAAYPPAANPFGLSPRLTGYVNSIYVQAAGPDLVGAAIDQVTATLARRHRIQTGQLNDFSVRNLSQIAETQQSSSRVMAALLALVASISLMVGGIGIMNILLVSVTERTREIGIRMAIGARRLQVLLQFLVEAVLLSVTGGAAGVAVGLIASSLISFLAHWPTQVSPPAIVGGFVFSAAVGVFFGFYPARKAARLNPIDALRYE